MEKKNLESSYFIAITPPEPLQSEVFALKQLVHEKFGSKGALRSPAHITLHMPFKWKIKKDELLFQSLQAFASSQKPFDLVLNDFYFFEPRVIFVDVLENEALRTCQKTLVQHTKPLQLFQADYKQRGFHPHMTIAFRDLKKAAFYEAKRYFEAQSLKKSFEVNDMVLLKHTGSEWKEFKRFAFKESKEETTTEEQLIS